MIKLSNLIELDVRCNLYVDNILLESALNLENRSIHILCNDTKVDMTKFVFKYPETLKECSDRTCCKLKYKNLKFETAAFSQLDKRGGIRIWQEDGLFYIGSSTSSEDDSYYTEYYHESYYHNDDEDEETFDEEETEMFKELS
jgi:hypothetical protein